MAFTIPFSVEIPNIGPGEVIDHNDSLVLDSTVFEDQLKAGVFAKVEGDESIENMDGSATPSLAGVVLRDITNYVENGEFLTQDRYQAISFIRRGLVSVAVKPGETAPQKLSAVYASNDGDADDGKATSTDTDVATTAEFVREVTAPTATADGVWIVRLV